MPDDAQHIIAIANHKGGVAKTTTAVNLAVGLSLILKQANPTNPKQVLFISVDPQGDGSQMMAGDFLLKDSEKELKTAEILTISELMVDDDPPHPMEVVRKAVLPIGYGDDATNLDYIPINPGKASVMETKLATVPMAETRLREVLEKIAGVYKYVVIDTPPSFSISTMNALFASTDLIIPVVPDAAHLRYIQSIVDSFNKVKKRWNPGIELLGVLPTRYDTRSNESKVALEELSSGFKERMFRPIVSRTDVKWAFSQGVDIFSLKPPRAGSDDFISENESSKELGAFVKEAYMRMYKRDHKK